MDGREVSPERSALDICEETFLTLTGPPDGLAVDARMRVDVRARRRFDLRELRVAMAHPATTEPARQECWQELIRRRDRPGWTVGIAGVAMPMLRRTSDRLAPGSAGDLADLDGDVLAGFLRALAPMTPDTDRIAGRLGWGAYRAGIAAAARDARPGTDLPVVSALPEPPWGHPAAVLRQAVSRQVLTGPEAELIARSRLHGQPLIEMTRLFAAPAEELAVRRRTSETGLLEAILSFRLGPGGAQ